MEYQDIVSQLGQRIEAQHSFTIAPQVAERHARSLLDTIHRMNVTLWYGTRLITSVSEGKST